MSRKGEVDLGGVERGLEYDQNMQYTCFKELMKRKENKDLPVVVLEEHFPESETLLPGCLK